MLSDSTNRWEFPSGHLLSHKNDFLAGEGVLLAVDWGDRRVGLALSDRERRFSWPVDPFLRKAPGIFSKIKDALLVRAIRELVIEEDVAGIVFGVPYYHLSGDPNPKVPDFLESGRSLSREIPLPLLFWDEGLSSEMARSDPFSFKARKKGKSFSKDPWIDSKSAAIILESFLTSFRCRLNIGVDSVLSDKVGIHSDEP